MHIYNVWSDDLSLDHWTYDPAEAMAFRDRYLRETGEASFITRYEEDTKGNVNVRDNFVRMTDADLLKEIA